MQDVLAARVLVLNRWFQAVQLTSVRRAFVLLFGGVAHGVTETGDTFDFEMWRELPVRSDDAALPVVGGALRVPRVIHLHRYERFPRPVVRLTRRNVMLRDGHQCQYCAKRPPIRELNINHIMPRLRGGADTWENLVTACRICNLRKAWRTPEEAGMHLLRVPVRPRWTMTARILLETAGPFKEWAPFLKTG